MSTPGRAERTGIRICSGPAVAGAAAVEGIMSAEGRGRERIVVRSPAQRRLPFAPRIRDGVTPPIPLPFRRSNTGGRHRTTGVRHAVMVTARRRPAQAQQMLLRVLVRTWVACVLMILPPLATIVVIARTSGIMPAWRWLRHVPHNPCKIAPVPLGCSAPTTPYSALPNRPAPRVVLHPGRHGPVVDRRAHFLGGAGALNAPVEVDVIAQGICPVHLQPRSVDYQRDALDGGSVVAPPMERLPGARGGNTAGVWLGCSRESPLIAVDGTEASDATAIGFFTCHVTLGTSLLSPRVQCASIRRHVDVASVTVHVAVRPSAQDNGTVAAAAVAEVQRAASAVEEATVTGRWLGGAGNGDSGARRGGCAC